MALDHAGIVSFHGPMIASDFATGHVDEYSFRAALTGHPLDLTFSADSRVQTLVAGEARGQSLEAVFRWLSPRLEHHGKLKQRTNSLLEA